MDIAKMSMALSQIQIKQQASLSIMNKVMDRAQGNADFVKEMMQSSDTQALQRAAQPHLGGSIDIKA